MAYTLIGLLDSYEPHHATERQYCMRFTTTIDLILWRKLQKMLDIVLLAALVSLLLAMASVVQDLEK